MSRFKMDLLLAFPNLQLRYDDESKQGEALPHQDLTKRERRIMFMHH